MNSYSVQHKGVDILTLRWANASYPDFKYLKRVDMLYSTCISNPYDYCHFICNCNMSLKYIVFLNDMAKNMNKCTKNISDISVFNKFLDLKETQKVTLAESGESRTLEIFSMTNILSFVKVSEDVRVSFITSTYLKC